MPKLAGNRNVSAVARPALSLLFAVTCVALLSACSPNQDPTTSNGTTPPVWTGLFAPSGVLGAESESVGMQSMTTHLNAPDGTQVATAKFEFNNRFVTITIVTTGTGQLVPGFHGVHIHKVGKCEPNSVAPTGGASGDFLSAGGHFQVAGHTVEPASGHLTSLQVRKDGTGALVTTTDAFTINDLLADQKTAIIIHAGADNFGNIPPERYSQVNGTPGPDATTMSTGDAGKRVACGVIGAG
ncbi:superoxide dismutase [Mycobacterium uberis]|uniref:Superoxide dismutase [Cu-Zn] n=1 Tax=Mycobacterium uberis TaxID=2162698 RepID=A0A3E1HHN1_9MYCO|nr:superoxide dismutase family protein [Mycobacterium uberis]RFD25952.1 superoxide dismutase [Mycobacterium uberis]